MALFLAPLRAPLKGGAHGATPGAPWFPSRAESQLALLSSWLAWGWAGLGFGWLFLGFRRDFGFRLDLASA